MTSERHQKNFQKISAFNWNHQEYLRIASMEFHWSSSPDRSCNRVDFGVLLMHVDGQTQSKDLQFVLNSIKPFLTVSKACIEISKASHPAKLFPERKVWRKDGEKMGKSGETHTPKITQDSTTLANQK